MHLKLLLLINLSSQIVPCVFLYNFIGPPIGPWLCLLTPSFDLNLFHEPLELNVALNPLLVFKLFLVELLWRLLSEQTSSINHWIWR